MLCRKGQGLTPGSLSMSALNLASSQSLVLGAPFTASSAAGAASAAALGLTFSPHCTCRSHGMSDDLSLPVSMAKSATILMPLGWGPRLHALLGVSCVSCPGLSTGCAYR